MENQSQINLQTNPQTFSLASGRKKVMIIDDSEEFRTALREFLEANDWEVDEQSNVQSALKKLKLTMDGPDLILLDYLMPLDNGLYFWNSLNDDMNLCHIPAIMLTAHDMNSINAIGIRAVLRKPVDTNHLLTLMNTLRNEKLLDLPSNTILN